MLDKLKKCKEIAGLLNELDARRSMLQEELYNIKTPKLSHLPKSRQPNISNVINVDLIDDISFLKRYYDNLWDELIDIRDSIDLGIFSDIESRFIQHFYFEDFTYSQVGARLGKSVSTIYRIHKDILHKLTENFA